jgi:hypothetical protein
MAMQQTDPWGQSESRSPMPTSDVRPPSVVEKQQQAAQTSAPAVMEKDDDGPEETYTCPHCGNALRPHHDSAGTLHCDSRECAQCCFFPPDAASLGRPRPRPEARPCPKAASVSGF